MENKDYNPGKPPWNPYEEAAGLQEAINKTKERISAYRERGSDTSDLEMHLRGLENQLSEAEKRMRQAA